MRAILINDIHQKDHPPVSRNDGYKEQIFDKLRWIMGFANDEKVDLVLQLGDVFDVKRSDRNSHAMVQEMAQVLGMSNAPVRIVPGNHDLAFDRLESIPSQPLGTLALHPNIQLLMGRDPDFPVFGIPYMELTPDNLLHWGVRFSEEGSGCLLGTHQSIFPQEEAPLFEHVPAEFWAEVFKAKWTAYGHIHSRAKAGAFYRHEGMWFCNNGAISRGSLHGEAINRELAVTLFDDTNEEEPFTSIPIPFQPANVVFKLDAVDLLLNRQAQASEFLNSLGSAELTVLTPSSILEKAKVEKLLSAQALVELEEIIEEVA